MNYALFISRKNFGVIDTHKDTGSDERIVNGELVTLMIAPQDFVDKFLKLSSDMKNYQLYRTKGRTQEQLRDAVLSFFYGHTFPCTDTDLPLESTEEVLS